MRPGNISRAARLATRRIPPSLAAAKPGREPS